MARWREPYGTIYEMRYFLSCLKLPTCSVLHQHACRTRKIHQCSPSGMLTTFMSSYVHNLLLLIYSWLPYMIYEIMNTCIL